MADSIGIRETPGLLKALQIPPEQQIGFILAKLGEISHGIAQNQAASERMEKKIDEIEERMAEGATTFALQQQNLHNLTDRVRALEDERKAGPHWLVKAAMTTVTGAVALALMWFLLQGVLANARGPVSNTVIVPQVKAP